MAQFCALSLADQRLHLEAHPHHVGFVHHVALVEGTLLAIVQHWPTATEVVGMPLTDAITCTVGMQLSILTGDQGRVRSACSTVHEVLWMFVPNVLDLYRQEVLPTGGHHELEFAGPSLGHIRWGPSHQQCRDKLKFDPYHVWRLLNQSVSPTDPPVARHWLWLRIALTAAWAAGALRSRSRPGSLLRTDTLPTAQ